MRADPVWAWTCKQKLDDVVKGTAYGEDKPHAQAQCRIDAPINEGQDDEEKIFRTKIAKEAHWCDQPTSHSLKGDDNGNAAVNQGLHIVLQEGILSF